MILFVCSKRIWAKTFFYLMGTFPFRNQIAYSMKFRHQGSTLLFHAPQESLHQEEHFYFGAYSSILEAAVFSIVPGGLENCRNHGISIGRAQTTKYSGVFHLLGENRIRLAIKFRELLFISMFPSSRSIGSEVISWEFLMLRNT